MIVLFHLVSTTIQPFAHTCGDSWNVHEHQGLMDEDHALPGRETRGCFPTQRCAAPKTSSSALSKPPLCIKNLVRAAHTKSSVPHRAQPEDLCWEMQTFSAKSSASPRFRMPPDEQSRNLRPGSLSQDPTIHPLTSLQSFHGLRTGTSVPGIS